MVSEQRAIILEEIQQIGDLLEVGRHVRVVPTEMDIVELDVDDVLDAISEAAGFFARGRRSGVGTKTKRHRRRERKTDDTPHFLSTQIHACDGPARSAPGGELIRGPLPIWVRKVAEL